MKERILTGWNFRRVIYTLVGGYMIVQSLLDKQWVGALLGGYFAAMGIFSLGCAGGQCYTPPISTDRRKKMAGDMKDIEFEEIKNN